MEQWRSTQTDGRIHGFYKLVKDMTQDEKQILLKDLCARLPYGVKVEITSSCGMLEASYDMRLDAGLLADLLHNEDDFKPYLRPLSSMTSKEWVEFCDCSLRDEASWVITKNRTKLIPIQNREDYLNSKHFDYRGLILIGLALEAPEGMYYG